MKCGVTIELIVSDGTTYFSAPEDFWTSQLGPELAATVGGSGPSASNCCRLPPCTSCMVK